VAWPSQRPRPAPRAAAGRLRLAYLSGDLYAHPVAWLLAPVLEAHDRSAVELHCFDHQARNRADDPMHQRLRAATEHWHAVADLGDEALAARIRDAGIDVLVDLSGHTEHGNLGVLALRPAPVQLSWLGYFGSTGVPAVDAVVLGDTLAPVGAEAFYTEPLERVTGAHFAYAPPPYAPPLVPPPSARAGFITFGSFNNPAKLGDEVVQLWSAVLQAVPDSRLVLKWKTLADPAFVAHTQRRFAACGVDPVRVQAQPASPHAQMLAAYGDIDVALDPFPFCGLVTTLEALWMGVPVVTLPWQRPVSRQSLAVLRAIGQDRGIATTPRDYVAQAVALAHDLDARQAWRGGGADSLRHRMAASPLADGRRLAAELEAIFSRQLGAHHARGAL
jgi:predicted O-linked N-acetylglucosamine transferase (SPINDLY family)